MRIITSQNLFDKYPGHADEITVLLKQLTPNIEVLPMVDYMATKIACDKIDDTILIVGGPDVIPFAAVANPATDPDDIVLTDRPYACTKDPTYLISNKVIARLPDEQLQPTFDYLKTMLTNQIAWHNNKTKNMGWFSIVASVWVNIASYMKTQFLEMSESKVAPPASPTSLGLSDTAKKFAYINLHGAQNTAFYYGQQGNNYPIALAPLVDNFAQCLLVTEACYGGYITGRNKELSIPMMALYSNAIGAVASTAIAYGPSGPPAQAADLLTKCFYNRIIAGESLGEALFNGKQDFARETIKAFGSMNGAARKTLFEFHLYACPDIRM